MRNMGDAARINARTSERFAGLDVLRLLVMWMIVLLHCVVHGNLLNLPVGSAVHAFCACAVNVYAMISGYLLVQKHGGVVIRPLSLWLQVLFYSVLITLGAFVKGIASFSDLIKSCFPILFEQYWYFSAYFLVSLFSPFLNKACTKMNRNQLRGLVAALLVPCCTIGLFSSFLDIDAFSLKAGYSTLWLLIMYLLGAYLRLHGNLCSVSRLKWAALYVCSCAVTLLSKYVIAAVTAGIFGHAAFAKLLFSYLSPTIVLAAVALIGFVSDLQLSHAAQKFVQTLSGATFGVYLIHDHRIIRKYGIAALFQNDLSMPWYLLAVKLLAVSISIFLICMIIDLGRTYLFRLLQVKRLCKWVENKLMHAVTR